MKLMMIFLIVGMMLVTGCNKYMDYEEFSVMCEEIAVEEQGFENPKCYDCGLVKATCRCAELIEGNKSYDYLDETERCFNLKR